MWQNMSARQGVTSTKTRLTTLAAGGRFMADHQVASGAPLYQCKSCERHLCANDFYASNSSRCKECVKARVKHRARTNPAVQEYDRARAKTPDRKHRARLITKRWREENPVGYAAQTAVSNAVRDGRLAKLPCVFCNAPNVHAHHRDYSKPLDVIWLCPKCHHRLHAIFPETEGQNKKGSA